MSMSWLVLINPKLEKNLRNRKKTPIEVEDALSVLVQDLIQEGPAVDWPNYGKLRNQKKDLRHCHLKKGRPTWVVCWEVDKPNQTIKVYYVGTHEKAPY